MTSDSSFSTGSMDWCLVSLCKCPPAWCSPSKGKSCADLALQSWGLWAAQCKSHRVLQEEHIGCLSLFRVLCHQIPCPIQQQHFPWSSSWCWYKHIKMTTVELFVNTQLWVFYAFNVSHVPLNIGKRLSKYFGEHYYIKTPATALCFCWCQCGPVDICKGLVQKPMNWEVLLFV